MALYLVWSAGLLLDLLRQSLVFCSDFSHRLLSARVSHCLSLGKDFLGTCSPAANERSKLQVSNVTSLRVPDVTIFIFGQFHHSPRVE